MLKDNFIEEFINKNISSISSIKNTPIDLLEKVSDLLIENNQVIYVSGIGKSGQISQKISSTFTSLGFSSKFIHPVEAFHGDLGIFCEKDVLICISKSGNTKELVKLAEYFKKKSNKIITITSDINSKLYQISNLNFLYSCKDEASPENIAPMASSTTSLVVGDMIASYSSFKKGFNKEDFSQGHNGGSLGLSTIKIKDILDKNRQIPLSYNSSSFLEVIENINKCKLGIAGILDEKNNLIGVLTDGDIRKILVRGSVNTKDNIKNFMSKSPKVIHIEKSLKEALEEMEFYKITSLFVLDKNNKVINIIHMHDILIYGL